MVVGNVVRTNSHCTHINLVCAHIHLSIEFHVWSCRPLASWVGIRACIRDHVFGSAVRICVLGTALFKTLFDCWADTCRCLCHDQSICSYQNWIFCRTSVWLLREGGKSNSNICSRPACDSSRLYVLSDDSDAFKRVAGAIQQSQAVTINNQGIGPRLAF